MAVRWASSGRCEAVELEALCDMVAALSTASLPPEWKPLLRPVNFVAEALERASGRLRRLNFAAFRAILAMQTNLSVRLFRVHSGWRRDEWAYRPLFICGKLHPKITGNQCDTGEKAVVWQQGRWRLA
jgi:hypothetical protein